MKIAEFRDVCKKLGMNKYFINKQDEDLFWEALSSNFQTMYFTFNKYDFAVAKYVDKKLMFGIMVYTKLLTHKHLQIWKNKSICFIKITKNT